MKLVQPQNNLKTYLQKQPSRGVPRKKCSENMQQVYRRTPMPKCDFNKVAHSFIDITLPHRCSSVNLLHIFRPPFLRKTSGRLLLITATAKYYSVIYYFSIAENFFADSCTSITCFWLQTIFKVTSFVCSLLEWICIVWKLKLHYVRKFWNLLILTTTLILRKQLSWFSPLIT